MLNELPEKLQQALVMQINGDLVCDAWIFRRIVNIECASFLAEVRPLSLLPLPPRPEGPPSLTRQGRGAASLGGRDGVRKGPSRGVTLRASALPRSLHQHLPQTRADAFDA